MKLKFRMKLTSVWWTSVDYSEDSDRLSCKLKKLNFQEIICWFSNKAMLFALWKVYVPPPCPPPPWPRKKCIQMNSKEIYIENPHHVDQIFKIYAFCSKNGRIVKNQCAGKQYIPCPPEYPPPWPPEYPPPWPPEYPCPPPPPPLLTWITAKLKQFNQYKSGFLFHSFYKDTY